MNHHLRRVVEGLLFVASEPVPLRKFMEVLRTIEPIETKVVQEILNDLREEYIQQNRAFRLEEIANGYFLRTTEDLSDSLSLLFKNNRPEKLSHSAAEVLAIIAYKQPITRPQIEEIRGVDSSGSIYSLIERQLVEPLGKLEAPGRPTLFGVTKRFLQHFGLRDIHDLPKFNSDKSE